MCASEISPGLESRPPPIIDASLAVWWIVRNGLSSMSGLSLVRSHATEYILDISICSSSSISGSIPASALASIVLPLPGGHSRRILCPPAAAMRSALFACSCPMICEKSTLVLCNCDSIIVRFTHSGILLSPVSISTISESFSIPITSTSGITDASPVLSTGRNIRFIPSSRASIVAGSAHCIGLTSQSSASSQRKSDVLSISSWNSISFPSIPSAIGRSYRGHFFLSLIHI